MKKQTFTRHLKAFDFKTLFNQLGWDHFEAELPIAVDDAIFQLQGVVEKKGFVILHCPPASGGAIPLSQARKKIEHKVAQVYFEHLIIYTDADQTRQVWQLALHRENQPKRIREISYYTHQDSEALFQRLKGLLFTLDEEEGITLVDVKARVMANLARNVEKITKKFYTEFKKQHAAFLEFIQGIDDALPLRHNKNKQWYASLMLNRLMFCYFIQKKGYLDQNHHYLQDKLSQTRAKAGPNQFYDFYRRFLRQLFHEGLGKPDSQRQITVSLGRIPFLNGGLFEVHELEKRFADIRIHDDAFETIFNFFDQWNWHLDTRVQASGKDINPDVIGYIFEKYINDRAAMGAYYTKEDITAYISKNCIIPFLCDQVKRRYAKPFQPDGEIWQMLRHSGDAYIYDAVKKGVHKPLPDHIAQGADPTAPHLAERRRHWNTPTPAEYALPTEIWRETVERRRRYTEARARIEQGAITSINDFITYNLNIRQFLQDIIENSQDPALIRHFYQAISAITVLDPTCGSGAFLFAALNILEPLYEACLQRMEQFCEEAPGKHRFFEKTLEAVNAPDHPNREYFICKAIILNNLYGVDIMKEAVEIAKLRLFLKMTACVDMNPRLPNYGLEPLPDIDFNIRAGNTLVGFATETELMRGIQIRDSLFADKIMVAFKEQCGLVAQAFERFRDAQLIEDRHSRRFKEAKDDLSQRLDALNLQFNIYLASVYNIDPQRQPEKYRQWLESHQPFHWFAEFYSIVVDKGGFDVVIGNPPYVEYSKVKRDYKIKGYKSERCGNIFAMVIERCLSLDNKNGRLGQIVPISSVSTPRMQILMNLLVESLPLLYVSNYAVRPDKLFIGADMNITIHIGSLKKDLKSYNRVFSSDYKRWYSDYRSDLLKNITYLDSKIIEEQSSILKIFSAVEINIWDKITKQNYKLPILPSSNTEIFYHSGGRYFRKCILEKLSNEYKSLNVPNDAKLNIIALLTSNLYYWYWIVTSDTYHVTKTDVMNFRFPKTILDDSKLETLGNELLDDLWSNSSKRHRNRKDGGVQIENNFVVNKSKHIIDKIDKVLAKHYNFTPEELDFIINYDIKYRMGKELNQHA